MKKFALVLLSWFLVFFFVCPVSAQADTDNHSFSLQINTFHSDSSTSKEPLEAGFILYDAKNSAYIVAKDNTEPGTYALVGFSSSEDSATVFQSNSGIVLIDGLPLSSYQLRQTNAESGFETIDTPVSFDISMQDDNLIAQVEGGQVAGFENTIQLDICCSPSNQGHLTLCPCDECRDASRCFQILASCSPILVIVSLAILFHLWKKR